LGAAVCALFVLLCARRQDYFSVSAEQISYAINGSIVCILSIGAHGVIAVAICAGTMQVTLLNANKRRLLQVVQEC